MKRFSKEFREHFGNRITRHFDKYCEITNPVKFDALHDIYKEAFTRKEWKAMGVLLGTEMGRECLDTGTSFDLYLPATSSSHTYKHQRQHITFGFSDNKNRPNLDLEYAELNPDTRDKIDKWIVKTTSLKSLRQKLWQRCDRLLDWGWERYRHIDGCNRWRGGPEPGQACNTAGQVYRIWPELLPFLPVEYRDGVRGAQTKSKLPTTILDYGSVDQFLCLEKITNDDGEEQTDEELAFERRTFDALTHILVQMSLMIDVPHVKDYPIVS